MVKLPNYKRSVSLQGRPCGRRRGGFLPSVWWCFGVWYDVVKLYLEKIMIFLVTLDRDEDGIWISECPSIQGCVSQGVSKLEDLDNIKEAIELCLEVRAERGMPLTIETRQIESIPPVLRVLQ